MRRGSRVSVASVRRALGGGSPNEIAPALKHWRARQQQKELAALPSGFASLPKGLAEQLLEFWHGARAAIRAELTQNPHALEGVGIDADHEALRAEVKELRARWHREVEQGSTAHAELRRHQALAQQAFERAAETERKWRLTQIELAADRQRVVALELQVTALAEREVLAVNEAARLHHKNEQLAKALAAAAANLPSVRRTAKVVRRVRLGKLVKKAKTPRKPRRPKRRKGRPR
jgi:hypothetical protein